VDDNLDLRLVLELGFCDDYWEEIKRPFSAFAPLCAPNSTV
jgi:hypothetical protein